LHHNLKDYVPRGENKTRDKASAETSGVGGWFEKFGGLFGIGSNDSNVRTEVADAKREIDDTPVVEQPLGVYIYGSVGCGKTFVMDMFFDCAPIPDDRKRRIHFHKFMLEVHARMHQLRTKEGVSGDPIPSIARDIASSAWLLCFDEFQVTDVADALIMRRLFSELFEHGTVMVATSNRVPDDLYYNGIQRHLFLPFIDELKRRCIVHDMDSNFDYRLSGQASGNLYYVVREDASQNEAAFGRAKFDKLFETLCRGEFKTTSSVQTSTGRKVVVPKCGAYTKVARFSFDDLCVKPLGAADFVTIAATFHTIFLEDVPVLNLARINQMRRLITLVDTLYDHRTKLIVLAEAEPTDLFDDDSSGKRDVETPDSRGDLLGTKEYVPAAQDEAFAWARTASRLIEMQSEEYVHRVHGKMGAAEYLYPVSIQAMSDEDVDKLWSRYDANRDGRMDDEEFRRMVEELFAVKKGPLGALQVTKEVLDAARTEIADERGEMNEDAFRTFAKVFTSGAE